jgi:hypothetical protein
MAPECASTALDPACASRLREWLGGGAGAAWLTGTPGSGMTSLVRRLTRDMEAVWLTPATLRSRQFLRDVCSHPLAVSGKRKVLVLDELDVVLGNEAAMLDVAFVVRHNTQVPVVCILKSSRAACTCDLAKKAALVLHFPPPTHDAMVAAVSRVAAAEGLAAARVDALCRAAPGDIRHVLQTLRADAQSTRAITMPTADAVERVLGRPTSVLDALTLFSADAGALPSGLFEVYWRATKDVDACTAYLELASAGDVVDQTIHARHQWDLYDVHGALTVASAAVTLPRAPGVQLDKYGTAWNKNYAQCSKAKGVRGVAACRAARGLQALRPEDLATVRLLVSAALQNGPDAAAEVARAAGLDATALLCVMRLWDSGYKLGAHNKVKKLL